MKKLTIIVSIVLSFFSGMAGAFVIHKVYDDDTNKVVTTVSVKEENTIKSAIDQVYDSVLLIETYNQNNRGLSSGTGFVYKKDSKYGYILTNHHVVSGASKIYVTLTNGEQVEATYLGSDEFSDVAVLSIEADKVLQVASLGKSEDTSIGDTVFTVGSPLGGKYMGTVTKGILSGKDRQVSVSVSKGSLLIDVIQTDAAINPGNSGGPLVNMEGKVIGITSLKLVEDEVEGMGFALPIEYALLYTERLEKGEEIVRPTLGIQLAETNNMFVLNHYKINLDNRITSGVVVLDVDEKSSAAEVGLKTGDVITKINDDSIEDAASFRYSLYKHSVGDTIKLTYIRGSKETQVSIKLTR